MLRVIGAVLALLTAGVLYFVNLLYKKRSELDGLVRCIPPDGSFCPLSLIPTELNNVAFTDMMLSTSPNRPWKEVNSGAT